MIVLPEFKSLDLEIDNSWLNVWFNEPELKNPLTEIRVRELINLCKFLENNIDIRGVTFRGRGGIFCAGVDLKAVKLLFFDNTPRDKIIEYSRLAGKLMYTINELHQFTIMAIEGAAIAGGFGLACLGDVLIVDSKAKFSLTETQLGLSPAQIAPYIIDKLGYKKAKLLLLTGTTLIGEELHTIGLADKITRSNNEMDDEINYYKNLAFKCSPGAIADTKKLLTSIFNLNRREQMEHAAQNFTERVLSEDAKEGVLAFSQKRKPKWCKFEE